MIFEGGIHLAQRCLKLKLAASIDRTSMVSYNFLLLSYYLPPLKDKNAHLKNKKTNDFITLI